MEFSIDEKLKLAMEKCDNNYTNAFKFSTIYPFTTENIGAYLPLFDLKDKSLFTVGSSGDQALNAILCGASDITVFDICPFTREYFYLKRAAIETLTVIDFLRFFCYKRFQSAFTDNKRAFDINIYLQVRESLQKFADIQYFWDEIFRKYNGLVIRKQLFNMDENKYKIIRRMNNYLNSDEAYNNLRGIIDKVNIKFVQGDIFKDKITGTFDNVFLSNLSSYYSLSEIRGLFDKMQLNLNDNGKMLIAYLYDTTIYSDDYMDGEAEIYDIPRVIKSFPPTIQFNSFDDIKGLILPINRLKDSVITYKKVKKK